MRAFITRYRWTLLATSFTLIVYAALGFYLVPRIARTQLQSYVTDTLHRQVTIGQLRFNPFTFTARIDNFSLNDSDGSSLIAFNQLLVNAELASLWQRSINLKEVRLDAPDAELIVNSDGSINLAQLIPSNESTTAEQPPPRIRIGVLAVTQGRVGIKDLSLDKPFSTAIEPIEFTLTEFKTDLNYANAYRFSGTTLSGEQLAWSGDFTVQPLGSKGSFTIGNLNVATVGSYLGRSLPFAMTTGELHLNGQYRLALTPQLELDVTLPSIAIKNLALTEHDNPTAMISLPHIDIAEVAMSYAKRSVSVKSITVLQAHVDLKRATNGALNITKLLPNKAAALASPTSSPIPSPTPTATTATKEPDWQASIGNIQLSDSSINIVDEAVKPAARFKLKPVSLSVNDWSTTPKSVTQIAVDIAIDTKAKLALSGSVQLQPLNASVNLKLSDFSLPSLQSYIANTTQLTLHTGILNVQGTAAYAEKSKSTPTQRFTGNVRIDNLRTTDNLTNEDFIKWQRLAINNIEASSNPNKLTIASIVARQPFARVVIAANQTVNVSHVLGTSTTASEQAPASESREKPSASAPPSTQVRIKKVEVSDGSAIFADYSIQPNFATALLDLNGTVTGLSTDAKSRAQVKLQGKVDRYAPMTISGEINPLAAAKYSDVALDFNNMELTTFNPYSGKFAGYNITKGKLSTQLKYHVEDRKLDAQHHVVLDNLEFGAKTDSKDAAPIPLKLAIALLKDRNGVIDLNLPVGGTLDDPKFRIGPIVWQALIGVFKKIASAPFAAIGALFGGGDELAYVEFEPGSAIISAIEAEKLSKLAKGMVERPELRLNIPLTTLSTRDSDALAKDAFNALLPPTLAGASDDVASNIKRLKALEASWKKLVGTPLTYPSTDDAESKSDAAVQVENKLDYLQAEFLQALKPDANALSSLARERANAVQAALLANPALAAQRVFLVNEVNKSPQDALAVRMEMELE